MMTAEIISGKVIAKEKREQMKERVIDLKANGMTPGLVVVLIGEDPASMSYVRGKERACEEVGIKSTIIRKPTTFSEEALLNLIARLNQDNEVDGILVQLPLPNHISETKVIEAISPEKDVDGFHPITIGRMMTGQDTFLPCTPNGIIEMVKSIGVPIEGQHVVVVGRSNIVGKPVGQLFLRENATVTYCHSRTKDLHSITRQADILIVAVGRARFLDKSGVKEGAIVIDVGVNRNAEGKLVGDVDFDEVKEVASYITPVPGGVGPMTITMLLENTIKSATNRLKKESH